MVAYGPHYNAVRATSVESGVCMTEIRVLTYNIWQGGRSGQLLDAAVKAAAPDVLLVNETPKTPLLWKLRCLNLSEGWEMRYVCGGRNAGSNMIVTLAGVEVEATYTTVLPQPLFRPRRGIAAALLRVDGVLLGVVSCHLSLDQGRRVAEVERVIEVAGQLPGVVVLGGDLNERPGGPCWVRLRDAGFVDHGTNAWPTFPAVAPRKRIDALLVRGEAEVLHHGDPGVDEGLQALASDHRPVLAVLQL